MKSAMISALVLTSCALAVSPSSAQESPKTDKAKIEWQPTPYFESADGAFSLKLRGRVHWDAAWIDDEDGAVDIDSSEFRTARLGIEGRALKEFRYRLEFDFAGGEVNLKDGWIQFAVGPAEIKIGQYKLATSLEEATSSQYVTFMERASFTDTFGFARQIGVSVKTAGKNWQFQIGAFRGAASDNGKENGTMIAARVSIGPKVEDIQLHFGAAIRYRDKDAEQADLSYSQRPLQHLSARFINTGKIADSDIFYGVEAAAISGPFSLQGEWGWLGASLSDAFRATSPGVADPTFSGGYISASYFLTGESRPYKASSGSFSRIKVRSPVHAGGLGAWELGFRFDRVDLSDQAIFGGEQDLFVVGLNWYPHRLMRVMVNYSKADIKRAFLVPGLTGADGSNDVETLGIRAQVNW